MKTIDSKENPHFKRWKKMAQNRQKNAVFLEGAHVIQMFVARFGKLQTLIIEKSQEVTAENRELAAFSKEVFLIPKPLAKQLSVLDSPSEVFAVCELPQNPMPIDLKKNTVLLDGIQNPLNLGAILRVAAAADFVQILISKNSAHVFNPKTLRAAQGANFLLDIFENVDLLLFLQSFKGQVFAACLDCNAHHLFGLKIKKNNAISWIFGSEGQGISEKILSLDNVQKVQIPMASEVESLNVASAAALCLFEVTRCKFC